jgi:hypothetical protein
MKVIWTLLKIVIACAILIPVSLIVLGTVVGLAAFAFRLALLALVAYGAFKLVGRLLRGPTQSPAPKQIPRLEPVDPYYRDAMRELDQEIPVRR